MGDRDFLQLIRHKRLLKQTTNAHNVAGSAPCQAGRRERAGGWCIWSGIKLHHLYSFKKNTEVDIPVNYADYSTPACRRPPPKAAGNEGRGVRLGEGDEEGEAGRGSDVGEH